MSAFSAAVIYESRYGNTEHVAYAIAAGLTRGGSVRVFSTAEAPATVTGDVTLLVVGAPTEGHGITRSMTEYLDGLGGLSAQLVAAFDTRLRVSRWLSGSAAVVIARKLEAAGANEVAAPMSFFVRGKQPALEAGELARAQAWGSALLEQMGAAAREARTPAGVATT